MKFCTPRLIQQASNRSRRSLEKKMAISRTRSAGAKVTDEEYARLEALAQARGITLGEWCREVLLSQLNPSLASPTEETILAEVLGLRMIVINLLRGLGTGEALTSEKVQSVIQWADREKIPTARDRLLQRTKGDDFAPTKPA
jgi:hypothetical protein